MADLFQQMAGPFAQPKGFEDLPLWGARTPLDAVFAHVRSTLIGRRVESEIHGHRLAFTLADLDAKIDSMSGAAGQADDVKLAAEDVEYAGLHFAKVYAELGNVHTRIATRPVLVCSPVDLTLSVTSEQAAALLAKYATRIDATCIEAGQARIWLRRHDTWGWVDLVPEVEGGRVALRPVAVGRRNRVWRLPWRLPTRVVPVSLPATARITRVSVEPGQLLATIRVDEWRVAYSQLLGGGGGRR